MLRGLLLLLALSSLGDRGAFVLILGFHVFLLLLLLLARGVASFLRGAPALLGGIRGLICDDEIILEEKLNRLELGVRFPSDPDPALFPSTLELLELGAGLRPRVSVLTICSLTRLTRDWSVCVTVVCRLW